MSDFLAGDAGVLLPDAADAPVDPAEIIAKWLELARRRGVSEALAATLATATPGGVPSSRTVRLAELAAESVVFGTSSTSRKGRDLADNPRASATLYWRELALQLRLDGPVEVLDAAASDALFADRPPSARAATVVSRQDEPLGGLPELRERAESLLADRGPIPRPREWLGYRLAPSSIEFWQGSPDRLHRRLRYERRASGGWIVLGLQP